MLHLEGITCASVGGVVDLQGTRGSCGSRYAPNFIQHRARCIDICVSGEQAHRGPPPGRRAFWKRFVSRLYPCARSTILRNYKGSICIFFMFAVYAGVLDGHGGWQCAEFVVRPPDCSSLRNAATRRPHSNQSQAFLRLFSFQEMNLLDAVDGALNELGDKKADPRQVSAALTSAFLEVDKNFFSSIEPAFRMGAC